MDEMNQTLAKIGKEAKGAAKLLRTASTQEKNEALLHIAEALTSQKETILKANEKDRKNAKANGLTDAMIERLTVNEKRIEGMQVGLRQMVSLPDPTMKTDTQWVNEQGLRISRRRVPLGVIGIIYESRPNVTVDASGLCLKAGNAVILRGGKEALESNQAIIQAIQLGLERSSLPVTSVQLITDPSRELATQFMQFNECVDCLIPRGGAGLIQAVVKNATIPVIETGTGNCHLYVHETADLEMAAAILINGKTQRPSVCNALESLLVDKKIAETALPLLGNKLREAAVEVRGDEQTVSLVAQAIPASEEDYATEFLDDIISVKVVEDYAEAIAHIDHYSTGHSDAIVTKDYQVAQDFLNDIDSAAVYVNASTRFTDGEMFGFGGEIGISTQKLHARGPMGLEALTSYKYVIEGEGQIRE
ncbi:glutamate-5-semialdehyde dehydrogenase [Lacticigenium naphthae]|uniref:glutamate-5-semialdehyde dehydrogenase n=1 Tax=Lacticigenium naphthae TaxID=515351 RepID=UPI0004203974|nr:glutamate-5-semialdehyde dehydrogenase [Lacticigenium naphthae]